MSRRPRGPSDRPPIYFDAECGVIESPDAPRMPQQGLLSRMALAAFALCCCGVVAMLTLFVASFFVHIPHVQQQMHQLHELHQLHQMNQMNQQMSQIHELHQLQQLQQLHGSSQSGGENGGSGANGANGSNAASGANGAGGANGGGPRRHAQRNVLHRLAMLKRAPAPARGVDDATVAMVFPHWRTPNHEKDWNVRAVLDDVVLALSYLAQEEET